MTNSRRQAWHTRTPAERIEDICAHLGLDASRATALRAALAEGGLSQEDANRLIENVVGRYALPFALAPNFIVDGRETFVAMVTEEPSVVAACSHAAKLAREGGGFVTEISPARMAAQIALYPRDAEAAATLIAAHEAELLAGLSGIDAALEKAGGGARRLTTRPLHDDLHNETLLVCELWVDVADAMGANALNTLAEALAPELARLTGAPVGLRILSNLCDQRLATARVSLPFSSLAAAADEGAGRAAAIVRAARFAELDSYRAATHNKGIMNGVDAVLLATGNDFRAVEAGAHAYAARLGRYAPLSAWRTDNEHARLDGALTLPLAVGVVGGAGRVQALARAALTLMQVQSAKELAAITASVGLAANLAALFALSGEGIQKGHMRLNRRGDVDA